MKNTIFKLLSISMTALLAFANIATVSVNAAVAPKDENTLSTAVTLGQNLNYQNILNINGFKDSHFGKYVKYGQDIKLTRANYRLKITFKKYYSAHEGLNSSIVLVCTQPNGCDMGNGQVIEMNREVPGSRIHLGQNPIPAGYFKTMYADFAINNDNVQNFRVYFTSKNGDELDIKEISLKQKYNSTTFGTEKLKNTKFIETEQEMRTIRQPNGWSAGSGNFGFRFADIKSGYPGSDESVLTVSSSTRVTNTIVRFEQVVNLNDGDTYNFDFNAKSNIVKGRGVKISLSCAQSDGCGTLANNQDLNSFNVPVSDNLTRTITQGFMVPESGNYLVRIYVNDGSEAVFDNVKLMSWNNRGEIVNTNSSFANGAWSTISFEQPKSWNSFGNWKGQVGRIQ